MSETKTEKKAKTPSEPKSEKKTSPKKKSAAKPKPEVPLLRGIVADCQRLNVRAFHAMTSGVVAILNRGDIVFIDQKKSEEGWYAVKTKNGKTGYCMKKYIKLP